MAILIKKNIKNTTHGKSYEIVNTISTSKGKFYYFFDDSGLKTFYSAKYFTFDITQTNLNILKKTLQ